MMLVTSANLRCCWHVLHSVSLHTLHSPAPHPAPPRRVSWPRCSPHLCSGSKQHSGQTRRRWAVNTCEYDDIKHCWGWMSDQAWSSPLVIISAALTLAAPCLFFMTLWDWRKYWNNNLSKSLSTRFTQFWLLLINCIIFGIGTGMIHQSKWWRYKEIFFRFLGLCSSPDIDQFARSWIFGSSFWNIDIHQRNCCSRYIYKFKNQWICEG